MSKKVNRDKFFIDSGRKWGSEVVNKVKDNHSEGFYNEVYQTLDKVGQTCYDYAVGNKTVRKGKKLTEDDVNFYQGAYLAINEKQLELINQIDSVRKNKKYRK